MAKEKELTQGITVKKDEDFGEWYSQVIQKSELADYSAVSGCIVFRPYSYEIWERIKQLMDERIKKLGVQNAYFPLFIPESLLTKEEEHVEGFAPEVAWVTHGGNTELGERLAVRPTSETIMYDSYSKWIRSHRDLPLKLNQWNSVVRWEFKHPVPFLRTREFLWNEGHTAFATKKEAEQEIKDILEAQKDVVHNNLALYGITGRKSQKEKFAGAEYSMAMEHYMPSGKAIQGSDAHFDGQNFAKAYDIKFLDKDGKSQYVWQNTWAITTRMIGVMIAVHGDDKGLVIPPRMAPTKAVIVPILFDKTKKEVLEKCNEIKKELEKKNLAVHLDDREEVSAGWKYNEWELKGIPIRIELGPKDLEKQQAVVVRRDTAEKEFIPLKDVSKKVNDLLENMQKDLFEKSKKMMLDAIVSVKTEEEFKKVIESDKIAKAYFCNDPKEEEIIKDKYGGAKTLCSPLEDSAKKGKCIFTGKEDCQIFLFCKTY
ncbi:proline--tRNA ligase [Nanoarchaeota archaeon]